MLSAITSCQVGFGGELMGSGGTVGVWWGPVECLLSPDFYTLSLSAGHGKRQTGQTDGQTENA